MPFSAEELLGFISTSFSADAVVHNKDYCAKYCCSDLILAEKTHSAIKKICQSLIQQYWWLSSIERKVFFAYYAKPKKET